jgi:hypothetical protein
LKQQKAVPEGSMEEAHVREKAFRQAEASCLLEGMDASGDTFYQCVRQRVVSGEIDADEMMRLLLEDSKMKAGKAAMKFAAAG